jgi:hypothetical protein
MGQKKQKGNSSTRLPYYARTFKEMAGTLPKIAFFEITK